MSATVIHLAGRRDAPAPALTEEDMAAALRNWQPPNWPTTVPEVLADPFRAQVLHGMARQLQRRRAQLVAVGGATHPTTRPTPLPPAPRFDFKRLAANDRDDD